MKLLAELFAAAGAREVRTYVQSGNVVYRATPANARRVLAKVSRALDAELGFAPVIVGRTGDELAAIASANPFVREGIATAELHVAFLADRRPVRTGSLPRRRPRALPALPARRRQDQADQRLPRPPARDDLDGPQLEHGARARRAGQRSVKRSASTAIRLR
jgi:hypothetical protein